YHRGLHWLAIFSTCWAFLIITVGVVVKSNEAGLSITKGFILEWIPNWWNVPNQRLEFFHRFIVPIIGYCTLALTIWTFLVEKRRAIRLLSVVVFLLVLVQAFIG